MRSFWKSKKILPLNTAVVKRLKKTKLTKQIMHEFCKKSSIIFLKKLLALSLYKAGWFPNLKFSKKINIGKTYLHFWARSSTLLPMVGLPMKKIQVYNGLKFYSYSCDTSKFFFKIGDFVPTIYVGINKFILKNKKTVLKPSVGAKKKN